MDQTVLHTAIQLEARVYLDLAMQALMQVEVGEAEVEAELAQPVEVPVVFLEDQEE
jgi:hypothetical protein